MSKALSRTGIITPERPNNFVNRISRFLHAHAMKVTFKTMLNVPQTTLYHPVNRDGSQYPYIAERYRGLLATSYEACTGCRKCERACPNKVILMVDKEIDGEKYRFPTYFAGRCMKCGLCEEACDRQFAIRHTDQYEDAGYIREQLYYDANRMWTMWDKHIQPRIDAGIAHRAVPDKKRISKDKDEAKQIEKAAISERKAQDEADPLTK